MFCQHCGKKLGDSGVCDCPDSNQNTQVMGETEVLTPQSAPVIEPAPIEEPTAPTQEQNFVNTPPPPQPNFNTEKPVSENLPQNFGGTQGGFIPPPPPPPQNFNAPQGGYNGTPPPPPQYNAPQQNYGAPQGGYTPAPPPPQYNVPQQNGAPQGGYAPPPPQNFNAPQGGYNSAPPPPMYNNAPQGYGAPPMNNNFAPKAPPSTDNINELRAVGASPITMVSVFSLCLLTLLAIINIFKPMFAPSSPLDAYLGSSSIDAMSVLGGIIGLTPQILVTIGFLLFMLSCMNKTGAPLNNGGLTLAKVGGIIWLCIASAALIILGIVFLVASSMLGDLLNLFGGLGGLSGVMYDLDGGTFTTFAIILGLVFIGLGVLLIFTLIGYIKSMGTISTIVVTGSVGINKVSMLLVIMLFISALMSIVSILLMFFNPVNATLAAFGASASIDWFALIINIVSAAVSACFGIALISLKKIK